MNKYRSYYARNIINHTFEMITEKFLIREFQADTDEIAIMISKSVEPYPNLLVRVEGNKEVEIRQLG